MIHIVADLMPFSLVPSSKARSGFSLPEVLVVMAVLSILGATSLPIVQNLSTGVHHDRAVAKAEALTTAKILFHKTNPDAANDWGSASDDAARFVLLRTYLQGDGVPDSLSAYQEQAPYDQFDLGTHLRDRVHVIDSSSQS